MGFGLEKGTFMIFDDLKSWFACSYNPLHESNKFKKAFTDWFSYVDISNLTIVIKVGYIYHGYFKIMEKKEVEIHLLVLKSNELDDTIAGFCRNDRKLYRVSVNRQRIIPYGCTFSFIIADSFNEICTPRTDSIHVDLNEDDIKIVKTVTGLSMQIPANIAFSDMDNAKSYLKTVGFSDLYGYVRIPSTIDVKHTNYNTVYSAILKINQIENDDEPVFVVVSLLEENKGIISNSFIFEMEKYEAQEDAKKMTQMGKNTFGKLTFPKTNGHSQNVRKDVRKPKKFDTVNNGKRKYLRILVTDVYKIPDEKMVYGKAFTMIGKADLLTNCSVYGNCSVKIGSWYLGSILIADGGRKLLVEKIEDIDCEVQTDCRIKDGNFYVTCEFDLRNLEPDNRSFSIIDHSVLGKVAIKGKNYDHTYGQRFEAEFINIKHPVYPDHSIQFELYKVGQNIPDGHSYLLWKQKDEEKAINIRSDSVRMLPQYNEDCQSIDSPGTPVLNWPNNSRSLACDRRDVPIEIGLGTSQIYHSSTEDPLMLGYHRNYPSIPKGNSYFESQQKCTGFVAKRITNDIFVVYCYEKKCAMLLNRLTVNSEDMKVGKYIEFQFSNFDRANSYYCKYEITTFIGELNENEHEFNDVKYLDNGDAAKMVNVDLSNPQTILDSKYLMYMSSDVDGVVVSDSTYHCSSRKELSANQIYDTFKGKMAAKEMACWCTYELGEVPECLITGGDGWNVLTGYHWKLNEIFGTVDTYLKYQRAQQRENIPEKMRALEDEDDLARLKELNQRKETYSRGRSHAPGSLNSNELSPEHQSIYSDAGLSVIRSEKSPPESHEAEKKKLKLENRDMKKDLKALSKILNNFISERSITIKLKQSSYEDYQAMLEILKKYEWYDFLIE